MLQNFVMPDLYPAARSEATVVVLMGLAKLPEIADIFRQAGKSELPVAVLQNGSLPQARCVFGTVGNIVERLEKEALGSPAVVVLGEVVGLKTWDVQAALAEIAPQTTPLIHF